MSMSTVTYRDPLSPTPPAAGIRTPRLTRARGRVARIQQVTSDTFEFVVVLDPAASPMRASAGQFAILSVPGIETPHAYSFARDPAAEADGEHSFLIRLVPGGEMSTWLASGNRLGAELEVAGPLGEFTLDASSDPMVLIGGGSGLSAVKALAEAACRQQLERDCLFLYGARTQADLAAAAGIDALSAAWNPVHRFEFVTVLSEEPVDSDWRGPRGFVTQWLDQRYLASAAIEPSKSRFWLCGPPAMITAGENLLRTAGVPSAHVYRDVFEDRSTPAPVIDNRRCVLCDECLLVRPVAGCIVETGCSSSDANGVLRDYRAIEPGKTAGLYYSGLAIDAQKCIRCSACISVCPHGAISRPARSAA
jgi:NAD(P)H-flavin reductase